MHTLSFCVMHHLRDSADPCTPIIVEATSPFLHDQISPLPPSTANNSSFFWEGTESVKKRKGGDCMEATPSLLKDCREIVVTVLSSWWSIEQKYGPNGIYYDGGQGSR